MYLLPLLLLVVVAEEERDWLSSRQHWDCSKWMVNASGLKGYRGGEGWDKKSENIHSINWNTWNWICMFNNVIEGEEVGGNGGSM